MAQEQFTITNREVDNLTKRNQHLYDQYTRIDIECNRVTEDLLTSNGRLEQLRNECANLRAEKKIWEVGFIVQQQKASTHAYQDVQIRLVDENKTLAIERSHLSDLMSNVQKMHNDLERSGENDRRRLESQIQMFESQTLVLFSLIATKSLNIFPNQQSGSQSSA
jgi:nucleoprotein TPR